MSPFLKLFGVGDMPWVIRAYLTLLAVCAALMLFALMHSMGAGQDLPTSKVLDLSIDCFKIVLGAVIGSLSMAATHEWGDSKARTKR